MLMTPEQQEKAYQFGCKLLQTAKKKKDYENLKLLFSNLPGYKDAGQLEEQCATKIRKLKNKATLSIVFAILICAVGLLAAAGVLYLNSPTSKYAFEENDDDGIIVTGLKMNPLQKDGTAVSIPEEINECSVVGVEALASETMVELTLPETLESISAEAFVECPALTTIHFSGTASQWMEIGGDALVEKYSIEHEGIHKWNDWVLKEGYRCHEGGTQIRTCEVCFEQEVEDAETREHILVELPAVEATCTATGLSTGWRCEFCGFDVTPQEETAMAPHTEVVVSGLQATCTETGLTEGKQCSVCGEITVRQEVIEMKPHTEIAVAAKEPTCSEVGLTEGVMCSVCGTFTVTQNEIAMIEHTPVKVEAKEPTCTEEGHSEGMKCSVCDTILSAESVIEKLPHNEVVIPAEEATCIKTGLTAGKKCSMCGEILEEQQVVEKTAHKEVKIPAVAATCTKTGLTEGKKCSVCGEVLERQNTISKVAHKEEVVKGKAATCIATGLTDGKKCSVCGTVLQKQSTISKTGHSYSEWKTTKSPTCTSYGEKSRSCTVCKVTEKEQLSIADHVYVDGFCVMCSGQRPSEGLVYKKNGNAYTITGIGSCDDYRVVIPDRHNGYPVTAIAGSAFRGATEMMEVVIPSSVTTIGDYAFYGCSYLISASLEEGLTTIGTYAFANCDSLSEIKIPDSVTKIGNYCFEKCYGLADIYLGSGITTSAKDVFRYCEGVEQVFVDRLADYAAIGSSICAYSPDAVFIMNDEEMSECIIKSDKDQAPGLFKSTTMIYDVIFKQGVSYIAKELFYGSEVIEVTIPRSVQIIGDYAFYDSQIETVYYDGTSTQWKRITKGRNCFPSGITISCSDEDIDY